MRGPDLRSSSDKAIKLRLNHSDSFGAVFAFGAPVLDPILTVSQFVTSVVDYFIFGQEGLWSAVRHTMKQEIMKHTSIYVATSGTAWKISDASWRRRPNGEDIRCCQQPAKYCGTEKSGMIKFRCKEPSHTGTRTFRVSPLAPATDVRRFWGDKGGPRYMIAKVEHSECEANA